MSKVKEKSNMFKNMIRAAKEVHSIKKSAFPIEISSGVIQAVQPYVNVIMLARIVGILAAAETSVPVLIIHIAVTVILNFIFSLASVKLGNMGGETYWGLNYAEQQRVNNILFSIDYKKLENSEFETLVRQYRESVESRRGHLGWMCWLVSSAVNNLLRLGIAFFLAAPLFKWAFVPAGETFAGSPWFFAVLLAVMGVAFGVIFIVQKAYNKLNMKTEEELLKISKTLSYYTDLVRDYKNGKEIRLFKMRGLINDDASENILKKGFKLREQTGRKAGSNVAVAAIVGVVVAFGVYVFIGMRGLAGLIGIDELVLYSGSFLILVQAIIGAIAVVSGLNYLNRSLKYYLDIVDAYVPEKDGKVKDFGEDFTIEFKNVSFKYDGSDGYAVKNLSLRIEKGEKVAIVGQNGSGKTTFIKLLSKVYHDYEGEIFLNGINLRDIDGEAYKKKFSIVFQDYATFSLSIAENVAADDTYDAERVERVARNAGLDEYLEEQQEGIRTILGRDFVEDGADMSGGEAQKLAIARAFYKDSECLILDEPTASLDPIAEAEFYKRFNSFAEGKTALYISHRLSSCVFCERILVFDKGRLIQNGTHEELLKSEDTKYYELWSSQVKYYV